MQKSLVTAILLAFFCCCAYAQPIYRFTVKVGIDCESVDSLGGEDKVRRQVARMFEKINRAFNHTRQFDAVYDFVVDWDAFYIYDGISTDEVHKPHPQHDYLVVIDGYKSDPRESGGGWYGSDILTVYHSRIHNDRFNDPFEPGAIDGIIHEFGHGRGMPDIYAMKVDADKNPIAPIGCMGTKCIMDYPYGETFWSEYAVNMINLSADKMVDIDRLVQAMRPDYLSFQVVDPDGKPVNGAKISFYPVGWYSYSVSENSVYSVRTGADGQIRIGADKLFPKTKSFGLKYPNMFVKAEYDGMTAYGWLPLYEIENVVFEGNDTYGLVLKLKGEKPSSPFDFDARKVSKNCPKI